MGEFPDLNALLTVAPIVASALAGQELTAVRFDDAGLQVAVGTRNGLVGVYDLRSQRPVVVKDHMYGSRWVWWQSIFLWGCCGYVKSG